METNNTIKTLANKASKLSGRSLEELRNDVRYIRREIALGADKRDVIDCVCGEDGEDHMEALWALMHAAV